MFSATVTARAARRCARSHSEPLAENYRADDYDMVDVVANNAEQRGVGPAVVALAWLLQTPGMTAPIIAANQDRLFDSGQRPLGMTTTGTPARKRPQLRSKKRVAAAVAPFSGPGAIHKIELDGKS